jgi:hypothetical protein
MFGGQLFMFFGYTVLVTMIVSLIGVWHYSSRVLAGMRQRTGQALPIPEIQLARPSAVGSAAATLAWAHRTSRRVALAWLCTAVLAAAPVAAVYLFASGQLQHPAAWVMVTSALSMVAVPVIAVSLGRTLRFGLLFGAGLLAAGAMSTLMTTILQRLVRGAAPTLDQAVNLWLYVQGAALLLALPTLLLVLCSPTRIRTVVPMVFGALVLFAVAPFLGAQALGAASSTTRGAAWVQAAGVSGFRHGAFLLIALPAGWLVSRRLRALAAGYAAKRFSDVQMLARSWWLMLVSGLVIELVNASEAPWWGGPACALAGLAFTPVNRAVLRWLPVAREAPPPRNLLFLRAFGWQSRTERLFDRLGARWRYLGPITMIAAPDAAARSIDPADLLAYLQGREGEAFVRSEAELANRLAGIDVDRDPDGRFRLTEFCCTDDTWQATVVSLMLRADAVLMDLRGVRAEKAGCAFELGQIALRLDPARVVLVIDGETVLAPLRTALGAAADRVVWHRLTADRPAGHRALFEALVAAAT